MAAPPPASAEHRRRIHPARECSRTGRPCAACLVAHEPGDLPRIMPVVRVPMFIVRVFTVISKIVAVP